MALRKPLFMTTDGYHEEMAATDSIQLGALDMSGDIAMNSNKVTGLAAASANGDAISYGQSNASLAGLSLTANLAMGNNNITGLANPVNPTDAANKQYVDGVAAGLDWKMSVRAMSDTNITLAGAQTIDGVALSPGDRVLVTGQTNPIDNGIYVIVDPGSWTRATDQDTGSFARGDAVFVEEGTNYADTGWVCTDDSGSDVVGTDSLTFTQFTGTGSIIAGAGLSKTGNQIDVELATNPALEFDAVGAGGKLRWKPDTTRGLDRDANGGFVQLDAAGALEFNSGAIRVKINPTPDTLFEDSSGLTVTGLPSLFKINDTAVGATVTAGNLDTLTNGSDASALHTHAFVGRMESTEVSDEAIAVGDPVYFTGTGNRVGKARGDTNAKRFVVGVNMTSGISAAAASLQMISHGQAAGVLSGATPGVQYWLAPTGGLTATRPTGGNSVIRVGLAKSATDLWVSIFDYGKAAA